MDKINKDQKELVLARIQSYSDDVEITIGNEKSYSKEELIQNVESETDIGKEIVEIQMNYLRDLVNGNIYKLLT
jgi:hypothetical protein